MSTPFLKRVTHSIFSRTEIKKRLDDLCSCLSIEEQEQILDAVKLRKYRKNEYIYNVGEMPMSLLCLIDGKVKVVREGVNGRPHIVRVLSPDNMLKYFGFRAAFSGQYYVTAAMAFEHSVIAEIPLSVISANISKNERLAWFFIKLLSTALGVADERQVNLTQKHIRGRLAETLLSLRDHYGFEDDGVTLSIQLSREDIANMSNMTTSNAIRTLSAFAKEHLVDVEGKKIKLIDIEGLSKVSHNG